jgi:hypothetical protein
LIIIGSYFISHINFGVVHGSDFESLKYVKAMKCTEIIANVKLSNTNWKGKNPKQKKIERLIKRKRILTVEEVWQSKGSIQMVMVKLIGE